MTSRLLAAALVLVGCSGANSYHPPDPLSVQASAADIPADATTTVNITIANSKAGQINVSSSIGILATADGQSGRRVTLAHDGTVTLRSACDANAVDGCWGKAWISASDAALASGAISVALTCSGSDCKAAAQRTPLGGGVTGGGSSGGGGGGGGSGGGTRDLGPATLDPDHVLLWGTLVQGTDLSAIANLDAPDAPLVGFSGASDEGIYPAYINPSGSVVYTEMGSTNTIMKMVRDSFEWDSDWQEWTYPSRPLDNDVSISTSACSQSTFGVSRWIMQAGTGKILYACYGGGDYYDEAGTSKLSGYTPHAWNANGAMLAEKSGYIPVVLDANGVEQAITGSSALTVNFVATRAHGDGFHVAVANQDQTIGLWLIDSFGAATSLGTYASAPTGYSCYSYDSQLDAAGNLYTFGTDTSNSSIDDDVVCKFGLPTGGTSEIVYKEAGHPDADWKNLEFWVKIHISRLITGP